MGKGACCKCQRREFDLLDPHKGGRRERIPNTVQSHTWEHKGLELAEQGSLELLPKIISPGNKHIGKGTELAHNSFPEAQLHSPFFLSTPSLADTRSETGMHLGYY